MHFLGYVVTLANLQNFADSQPTDLAIQLNSVQKLAKEILNLQGFPLDGFRKNGYYRVGDTAKYLSKNLQNYLFYKTGDPNEDALVLTLKFSEHNLLDGFDNVKNLRKTFFVHRQPASAEEMQAVKQFAKRGYWPQQYLH